MSRTFFSRERISDFDLFARYSDKAIGFMKDRLSEGYALDIQDLSSRFTLDSASEFLFGRSVNTLRAGLPYPHNAPQTWNEFPVTFEEGSQESMEEAFSGASVDVQQVMAERMRLGWIWPLAEVFRDKSRDPMKAVRAYLDPIVENAVQEKREKETKGYATPLGKGGVEEGETLLEHLVKVTDGAHCHTIPSSPLTEISTDQNIIKDEILNIIVAGRDTVSLPNIRPFGSLPSNRAFRPRLL